MKQQDATPHWYVVRATYGRGKKVYDEIVNLHNPDIEVYMPHYHVEATKIEENNPQTIITEVPLHKGLVFVRTTRAEYIKLLRAKDPYPAIEGLTPYFNHFCQQKGGRVEYLTVPDRQLQNFRKILESRDVHILVDQEKMPTYLNGKKVEIIQGPYAGLTGTMLRWKGLRRVFIQVDNFGTYATGFVRTCDFRLLD